MEATVWQWGPFRIGVYSLFFFSAVLVGLTMALIEGRRKRLPEQLLIDFLIIAVVCGIIGGRLTHVLLFDLSYYLESPARFFRLQDGGMSLWGGIVFSLAVISLWLRSKRLITERYLDAAAPALTAALALGYVGIVSGGRVMPAGYPWGISSGGLSYHPIGAYMIVLLAALHFVVSRRRAAPAYEGELFIWSIAGYGLINLVVDNFREAPLFAWALTAGQAASLAAVALAILYILTWPKIHISSYYGIIEFGIKSRKHYTRQLFLHLLAAVFLVLLYYEVH